MQFTIINTANINDVTINILSSNENIKVLVLDTEVYSNTGGQASKSSRFGQVAQFADAGKKTAKKDLFKIAMSYPNCYVASVSLGSNFMQTIKAFKEAEEHHGPSIIIAYCPCIEHGIKTGMEHSQSNAYLATECGYFITFRHNPDTNKFIMDSKDSKEKIPLCTKCGGLVKPDVVLYQEGLDENIIENKMNE